MAHLDYLSSIYDLPGRDVADIGAGDGTFARQLDHAGAVVTGIEIDPAKVERASQDLPDSIAMLVGRAENLPIGDGTTDLACFFFSFHHVPMEVQPQGLAEVQRILRPRGRLHVVEPYPYGSMFDVVRMVEDETEVRTQSHNVMDRLSEHGDFNLIARTDYTLTREYPDFEFFIDKIVLRDPERSAVFPSVREKMAEAYDRVISESDGKRVLHQPCAAYHFESRH